MQRPEIAKHNIAFRDRERKRNRSLSESVRSHAFIKSEVSTSLLRAFNMGTVRRHGFFTVKVVGAASSTENMNRCLETSAEVKATRRNLKAMTGVIT